MGDPTNDLVSPWQPMSRPIDLKHIGKLLEELGEAVSAASPYVRDNLQNELADVIANIELCETHFQLTVGEAAPPTGQRITALKFALGQAVAAASRCLIQGIDGTEPTTGRCNKEWLQETLTNLKGCIRAAIDRYRFYVGGMQSRTTLKKENLRRWHQALE